MFFSNEHNTATALRMRTDRPDMPACPILETARLEEPQIRARTVLQRASHKSHLEIEPIRNITDPGIEPHQLGYLLQLFFRFFKKYTKNSYKFLGPVESV